MGLNNICKKVSYFFGILKKVDSNTNSSIEERLELKIQNLKNDLLTTTNKDFFANIESEIKVYQHLLDNIKKDKK